MRSLQPGGEAWLRAAQHDVHALIRALADLPCTTGPTDSSLQPLRAFAAHIHKLLAAATGDAPPRLAPPEDPSTSQGRSRSPERHAAAQPAAGSPPAEETPSLREAVAAAAGNAVRTVASNGAGRGQDTDSAESAKPADDVVDPGIEDAGPSANGAADGGHATQNGDASAGEPARALPRQVDGAPSSDLRHPEEGARKQPADTAVIDGATAEEPNAVRATPAAQPSSSSGGAAGGSGSVADAGNGQSAGKTDR